LNASLIQSIVEATSVGSIDESGKQRAARKIASWQRNNRNIRAGRKPSPKSPSDTEVYDDVNKIHGKIALKALRPYGNSNERPLTKRERNILKQTETRNPGRAKTTASVARYDARDELISKGQENARFSRAYETKGTRPAPSRLVPSVSMPGTLSKEESAKKRAAQAAKREAAAAELAKPRLPKITKESFEEKLKFAHIVKRLSKSALANRAAKIRARNEGFDGIAEEADETPKPKRIRKPKAAAPAPAKPQAKRVVKPKRVSPFENLFAGKGHKLSNETLALKKEYDAHRAAGHNQEKATDMVYAGVAAKDKKKKAILNRILNTPREPSTIQLARGVGKAVNRVGRAVNTVGRGVGRAVNTLTDRELLPALGKSLAKRAGRGVGGVSRAAMRSKVGKVVTAAATEYSRVRAANESIEVNELNSTLGKLQAARKRRKTARLALNNSVIVDQINLVNEAKPSTAVRNDIVQARKREGRATRLNNLGKLLRGNTRVAKAVAAGESKSSC
jgi:hypothetical protein